MKQNAKSHQRTGPAIRPKVVILALVLSVLCFPVQSGTIVGSRHDLSTGTSPEICIFCHTPHNSNPDTTRPLWNRAVTEQVFTLYTSSTINNPPGQPSPVSLLCLSCHDGVNSFVTVNGNAVSTKHDLVYYHGSPDTTSYPNCERCHSQMYTGKPSSLSLGTDLSNDHPISMIYPAGGAGLDFNVPPNVETGWGPGDIKLVAGKVECVSCHEVHDPDIVPFLVKTGELCLTCHLK